MEQKSPGVMRKFRNCRNPYSRGGAAVMVFVSENQKKKEKKKRESEEMRRDYPQIINRFSLYIGAGMSVRNAWQRITEDYRKIRSVQEKKSL